MRLARGDASHFHAACLFRTTCPICDLHEIRPCLGVFTRRLWCPVSLRFTNEEIAFDFALMTTMMVHAFLRVLEDLHFRLGCDTRKGWARSPRALRAALPSEKVG